MTVAMSVYHDIPIAMPKKSDSSTASTAAVEFPWLQRRNQILWASCVTVLLSVVIWDVVASRMFRPSLIDIDSAAPMEYQFTVDINEAAWPELSVLPGISEAYARRIVEYRTTHGPFATVEQLTEVSGIGPKRLRALREFLTIDSKEPSAE